MRSLRSITIPTAFCRCAMGGSSANSSPESPIKAHFRTRSMLKLFGALRGRTESVLLAAILVTAIVFSLSLPYFFTLSNLVNLIEAYSVTTIFAAGAFVVLVSGGIDVSFTATAAASQYLAPYLIAQVGCPAAPAVALAAILGAALG